MYHNSGLRGQTRWEHEGKNLEQNTDTDSLWGLGEWQDIMKTKQNLKGCESAALNMPANLEKAVATGLQKVSFHSNP